MLGGMHLERLRSLRIERPRNICSSLYKVFDIEMVAVVGRRPLRNRNFKCVGGAVSRSPIPLVDDDLIFGATADVPPAMSRPVGSHLQFLAGNIFVYGDLYPSRNRSPSGMNDIGFVENQVEFTFRHIGSLGSETGDRVLTDRVNA